MEKLAKQIIAYGRVQGVGFRPSVCRLAMQYSLTGFVRNLGGCVEIIALGSFSACEAFVKALYSIPEPAHIDRLEIKDLALAEFAALYDAEAIARESFFAVASTGGAESETVTADIGLCPTCQAELLNPQDRRYRYPYISCAQCGPRYTIMERMPYDRINTTMKRYNMCPDCEAEYKNMQARRGHGETISCHYCGPQLYGYAKDSDLKLDADKALVKAQELLLAGKIVMVKAVGGYNLVCRADVEAVVAKLRALKHRPTKPFAVMCRDIEAVERLCQISSKEQCLLTSSATPIVLLKPKAETYQTLATNVAANCARLGVFLPPMGVYNILCATDIPLIVTSCNFTGAPIIYKDEDAFAFYEQEQTVAGIFTYDREILRPADDSVVKVAGAYEQILRRTKGYMPEPIAVAGCCGRAVLAMGAQMEPSFCLGVPGKLYPGQIPGELEDERTEQLLLTSIKDWQSLLKIEPQLIVSDLHPNYTSTSLGQELADKHNLKFVQIQHHYAHALAVMAEHNLQEQVLAVCFDGTGYGDDGTIWGGEFLLCDCKHYERFAHLESVPMLGGDESMKQAWKSALCYLGDLGAAFDSRAEVVQAVLKAKLNVIKNSSMGRLFAAVAAVLGIADYNSHTGRCAQALEAEATVAIEQKLHPLDLHFTQAETKIWSAKAMWPMLLQCKSKAEVAAAALGFHEAVVEMLCKTALQAKQEHNISKLVLGGGCFANSILLARAVEELEKLGFEVYFNKKVSPGDGGIALGQAYYGIMLDKTC